MYKKGDQYISMSYSERLNKISNNGLNKLTVNGRVITPDELDELLNTLINSSRVDTSIDELEQKGITSINFLSPDSKYIPMTIKLIKGEDVNGKK